MTTCVYSRPHGIAAADTQNTTPSGGIVRVNKIETLSTGDIFMGSGHLFTIKQCMAWAETKFRPEDTPDWTYYLEDPDERGFDCLVITADGEKVYAIDAELAPVEIFDDYVAVGSGGAYALGALHNGATPYTAVRIAAGLDPSTSEPIHEHNFREQR